MTDNTMAPPAEENDTNEAPKTKRPRLTPQQLERKRKSDRENQRAVRYAPSRYPRLYGEIN